MIGTPAQPRYRAFLSYSHRDEAESRWLHRRLEGYRVPRHLAREGDAAAELPARLYPVFRDREELPTSADLGEMIQDALSRSDFLVVLCSPRSARSRWVNEEVLAFKRSGRGNRIICVIIDGEPNASDTPGMEADECFPPAVRFDVGEDGELTETRCEPIAADARAGRDGRDDAFLKVAAAIMGVGFDQLKRRDAHRRQRRLLALTGVSAAIAAVTLLLAAAAFVARNDASRQRDLAEERAVEGLGLLSGTLVDRGWQAYDQGDLPGALLWQTEALRRIETAGMRTEREQEWARAQRRRVGHLGSLMPELVFSMAHERTDEHISGAIFSPDGSMIATIGWDGTARVWDAHTGAARFPPLQIETRSDGVAFSPDGSVLATGSSNGAVRLWSTGTGQQIGETYHAGEFAATRIAGFSPDGSRVFVWSLWAGAAILDAATGAEMVRPDTPVNPWPGIVECMLSPDRRHAAACLADGSIMRWDTTTGAQVGKIHTVGRNITTMAYSDDGTRLAAGCQAGMVWAWDMTADVPIGGWNDDGNLVNAVDWAGDNQRLLVSLNNGEVRVLDLLERADPAHRVSVFNTGEFGVRARFITPDTRYVASFNDAAWVVSAVTGRVISGPMAHGGSARDAVANADSTRVLTWSGDGTARLWDPFGAPGIERIRARGRSEGSPSPTTTARAIVTKAGQPITATQGTLWSWARSASDGWQRTPLIAVDEYFIANGLLELPDGRVVTAFGPTAFIIDPASGETTRISPEHTDGVYGMTYDAERNWLFLKCGGVAVADASTGAIVAAYGRDVGPSEVTAAAFLGNGERAVVAHAVDDGGPTTTLSIVSLHEGDVVGMPVELKGAYSVSGLARGGSMAIVIAPGAAELRPIDDLARVVKTFPHAPIIYSARSSGDLLILEGYDDVRVWNIETGEPVSPLIRHDGTSVTAISHDRSLIATGSIDGSVLLWNVADGRIVMPSIDAGGEVSGLSFAPGDEALVIAADDALIVPITSTNASVGELTRRAALLSTRVIDSRGSVERLGRQAWLDMYNTDAAVPPAP